jgi:hypothetical protein
MAVGAVGGRFVQLLATAVGAVRRLGVFSEGCEAGGQLFPEREVAGRWNLWGRG